MPPYKDARNMLLCAGERALYESIFESMNAPAPVSYTHLDVYKRQVDSRLIPFNPFHKVNPGKLERADKQERRAFTMEEAKRLTEVLPGEWPDICLLYTSRCV